MRTPAVTILAATVLLSAAPAASAKPVKLADPVVDRAGTAGVRLTNPNRHAVRGKVTLRSGRRVVASSPVRLRRRAAKRLALALDRRTATALRSGATLRATLSARLRRAGGRATTTSRVVSLRMAGSAPAPGSQTGPGAPGGPTAGNGPASPASPGRWLATTSSGTQFSLRLDGSVLTLEEPPSMVVSCAETGGSYRVAASVEQFDVLGGWALGEQSATQEQSASRVNPLVGRSARPVRYRLSSTRSGDGISGSINQTFFDSKYDVFSNTITYVNCAGTLNFSAVPSP